MIKFNYADYELVTYYGYTTSVKDRLFETDYMLSSDELSPMGKDIKHLFDNCCLEAELLTHKSNIHWMQDNKCAFKIRHINSGKCLFVGFYDCQYTLGLGVKQYFGSRLDFETMTWNKSLSEDYSREVEY